MHGTINVHFFNTIKKTLRLEKLNITIETS